MQLRLEEEMRERSVKEMTDRMANFKEQNTKLKKSVVKLRDGIRVTTGGHVPLEWLPPDVSEILDSGNDDSITS